MTKTSDFASKMFAAIGAMTITATLFVSSFANPNATTVLGVLA
ncbi:hypothetical protein [Aurantiacibacter aquimixticola]|nr:hypothetical protein [Aurantiacibacter aquimixticola]